MIFVGECESNGRRGSRKVGFFPPPGHYVTGREAS
jgi:hypothetical protein